MERTWWKEAVVYQIYPRSFKDSDGDGVGDIQGIVSKLDYLQELGVDVIWLSPVYKSPNDDNGYDISDYFEIMDEFGTMQDWTQLLDGLHERGMKLLMDLVVNHTSDEHAWFAESRSSRDNPYRDYYIWRPGKSGNIPPNNWRSFFSGSAWKYDDTTGEYYLHLFSKKQPDLNWDNPKLRQSVYEMMTFWLDKGVDGFRMDVINLISKVPGLPDDGEDGLGDGSPYFMNGPHVHDYLREMNEQVLSKYDVMTVGETPGVSVEEALKYTGADRKELQMVFQFEHMDVDAGDGDKWTVVPWTLQKLRGVLHKWQTGLAEDGWNSLYLNNHDQPRMVSRFGNDGEYRVPSAKMLATLLHTLKGTPYIYQGEELGMTNIQFNSIEDYRDIEILNMYEERVTQGNADPGTIMEAIHAKGRDNARTPMQWNAGPNAGFTTGTPWIRINPNYKEINAEASMSDPDSVFRYYQRLISLRKQNPVMVYGDYQLMLQDHEQIYAYTRTLGEVIWLIALNFSEAAAILKFDDRYSGMKRELIIGNYPEDGMEPEQLRPYEARVYRMFT
ncbi:alpha-glucosidase [Paenibacillus cellulositrophicus]|uniref:glycoside hydrolase family 13 protein n=1 Tax=Paenibacillus cellulositrophicus TaxID=562959 RepID=UPI00203ABC7F|nr:alpha-glucosidase [Paenibacillus cellulositrophicus]MCM2997304.1 alpha-glucosidase [Paenibacillus cellulositrophicus]